MKLDYLIDTNICISLINEELTDNLKVPDAIILATTWECESILLSNEQKLTNIKEVSAISLKMKN